MNAHAKALGVDPALIADKLAKYMVTPDAQFPVSNVRTLVDDAVRRRESPTKLERPELEFLVLVAVDALWKLGEKPVAA